MNSASHEQQSLPVDNWEHHQAMFFRDHFGSMDDAQLADQAAAIFVTAAEVPTTTAGWMEPADVAIKGLVSSLLNGEGPKLHLPGPRTQIAWNVVTEVLINRISERAQERNNGSFAVTPVIVRHRQTIIKNDAHGRTNDIQEGA